MSVVDDEKTLGQVAAVSKLYVLAVLNEIESATRRYLAEVAQIKARYKGELSTGPDQFAMLMKMAEAVVSEAGRDKP